ncbi:hypothetical protein LCGC14_1156030 [marine sediment metagenome]|uniref:Uncharacterized protein n=1 Tax=marine sediment metagenome TaxID=412755 RepID=A0A0F9PC96_9ZZZZ
MSDDKLAPVSIGWQDRGHDHGDYGILDDNGNLIAKIVTGLYSHAEQIVRCVNSHDALVEAARRAAELYDRASLGTLEAAAQYGPEYEPPTDADCLKVRGDLEAALALATETKPV